jgi:cell division protein FtsW
MRGELAAAPREDANIGTVVSAVGVLAGIGAVAVFSATASDSEATFSPYFVRHAVGLVAGALLMLGAARIPLNGWRVLAYPLWGVSVVALLATLVLGFVAGGARRWLMLPGGVVFQPVELAKLATVLALCAFLFRNDLRSALTPARCVQALGFAAVPMALCLLQPDLGSAVVIAALTALVLFVAGAPIHLLAVPSSLGLGGIALYCVANPYAMKRVLAFLDPFEDSTGIGFQLVQSFVAFGRGELFGTGVGNGLQKLDYLPEAHTDFILSVIAEEAGLVGVTFVLGFFAALVWAGMRIAQRAPQRFGLLLGFGMTAFLGLQAVLNGAVVMGLLPPKGLTLPFVSYGRSSLLICAIAAGILVAVARGGEVVKRGSRSA